MLNHISIMGRLTRDPEIRYTPNNIPVASFTLAVDRDFKNGSGEKETDFINCVAWRSTAEFVEKYFSKGRMIVVSGRLQIRKYTDKDGNPIWKSICHIAEESKSFSAKSSSKKDAKKSAAFKMLQFVLKD